MEGASDFGEVLDEPLVEVHKSYEGLDIFYFCWLWPVHDSLDFNGVHPYMVSQPSPPDMEMNLERARLGPAARLGPQPLGVRLEPRMVSQGYHSRDSS